jgi:molybdopterin molybdotransferase
MSTDVRMRGFASRATVAEAEALIAERVREIGDEKVPFSLALGRVLAEDVLADRDVPPHPKAAMDGYAVRAVDLPGRFAVVAELMAADEHGASLGERQAVRIMTGARVVEGADTVVMVEQTRLEGAEVVIDHAQPIGTHVLARGEDLTAGHPVLERSRRIRPQDVAMLVTVGALEVRVKRRPRVRIVPTGTELVPVGTRPVGSQVVESNSYMIAALAERDGAEAEIHPIVPDDSALLERVLTDAEVDLVVITGGSSVGMQDLGPVTVRKVGELPIHGVHAKPASPSGIGFVGKTAVVLAPGFPVASYVAWDLFGRVIVQRMLGLEPALPYAKITARLAKSYEKPANRVEVQRVVLSASSHGRPIASILAGGAALLSTTTRADGFLLLPAGRGTFASGEELEVHLY